MKIKKDLANKNKSNLKFSFIHIQERVIFVCFSKNQRILKISSLDFIRIRFWFNLGQRQCSFSFSSENQSPGFETQDFIFSNELS